MNAAEVDLKLVLFRKSYSIHVSKTIHAPLRFVYDWCTDYRETDPKITGSNSKRKILLKTEHRVVYTESYRSGGKPRTAVDVVTLYPPKAWHLDYVGDEDDEVGDYVLTSLGPQKTRLDMAFKEHYKVARGLPSKAQCVKDVGQVWDKYVQALERDYRRSRC
jgi:hypothetical protein